MQRIAKLFGYVKKPDHKPPALPVVLLLADNNIRTEVLENVLPNGEYVYRIRCEYFVKELSEWFLLADFQDYHLEGLANTLASAKKYVDGMHGYFQRESDRPAFSGD